MTARSPGEPDRPSCLDPRRLTPARRPDPSLADRAATAPLSDLVAMAETLFDHDDLDGMEALLRPRLHQLDPVTAGDDRSWLEVEGHRR
jgi:hypothetical protein